MLEEKIVTILVEEGVLIRITNDIKEADYVIPYKKVENAKKNSENISIKQYLVNNKISLNAGGFNYLIMAITIVSKKVASKKKYSLSKDVYPAIAEKYCVTALSVERAIWNAIERSNAKGMGAKKFIQMYKLGL